MADVEMPQLGETVTEGTVTRWFKQIGDTVALDEALFEVSTDKVDTEVPSPTAGVLLEILANEGDLVEVGQVLARVGDSASAGSDPVHAAPVSEEPPLSQQQMLLTDMSRVDTAARVDDEPQTEVTRPAPADTTSRPASAAFGSGAVAPDPASFPPGSEVAAPDPATAAPDLGAAAHYSGATASDPVTAGRDPASAGLDPGAAASDPVSDTTGMVLSPVVRRLIAESGLDASTIVGTGLGGRITRADAEQAIAARNAVDRSAAAAKSSVPEPPTAGTPAPERLRSVAASASTQPPATSARPQHAAAGASTRSDTGRAQPAERTQSPTGAGRAQPAERKSRRPRRDTAASTSPAAVAVVSGRDTVVPLNNIRRRTADHMVRSKQTSPHVLTAVEVDYEGVEQVRRKLKQAWKAEEGFGLSYLPFISRAVIDALRDYPHLNASFGDDGLVVHSAINLAVAVDIDFQGLLAPVVHDADGKRLRQIAREIVDLADRARNRKLGIDDLSGGTFTLTNAGQYGTMMQFPIINQPQVAILSTDGVARKPVVITDARGSESIAIHSVGVLAMAWDHRAFDGAYAAAFLHRVREIIETRNWEAEIR